MVEYTCIVYDRANSLRGTQEFVETQDEWEGKWNKSLMYYDVIGKCKTMSDKDVKKALNYAMTTWDLEINVTFKPQWFERDRIIGPDITLDFKSKEEEQLFKDRPSVLAYAYFPSQGSVSGKVVFNNEYIWDFQGKGMRAKEAFEKGYVNGYSHPDNVIKTYSIVAVLIHELGHSLGLRHDVTGNSNGIDVMDAYYSGNDRFELSDRDLYRIRLKYPPRIYSNWQWYARLKNAVKRAKQRL